MKNKQGVTLIVLLTALTVMLVIISSATVIGVDSINSANFEEYKGSIGRVKDNVNQYYLENGVLPITKEIVSATSLEGSFLNAINNNSDENNKLYVIDISLLKNDTIRAGKGSVFNKDVYVVSENTNNIYYLKGFKYKGKIIYDN